MSISTDAYLSYGIMFPEGYVFPWDSYCEDDYEGYEGYEGDMEAWWRDHRSYTAEVCPVTPVNYCSGNYEMLILAVPSSVRNGWRGHPTEIELAELIIDPKEEKDLIDFCEKYCKLEYNCEIPHFEPKWYLSSYWDG